MACVSKAHKIMDGVYAFVAAPAKRVVISSTNPDVRVAVNASTIASRAIEDTFLNGKLMSGVYYRVSGDETITLEIAVCDAHVEVIVESAFTKEDIKFGETVREDDIHATDTINAADEFDYTTCSRDGVHGEIKNATLMFANGDGIGCWGAYNYESVLSARFMFKDCKLGDIDPVSRIAFWRTLSDNIKLSKCRDFTGIFSGSDITSFDTVEDDGFGITNNAECMGHMFAHCTDLQFVDMSFIGRYFPTSVSHMFTQCKNLLDVELGSLMSERCIYYVDMFNGCEKLEYVTGLSFNTNTKFITGNMRRGKFQFAKNAFKGCTSLSEIEFSGSFFGNTTGIGNQYLDLSDTSIREEGMLKLAKTIKPNISGEKRFIIFPEFAVEKHNEFLEALSHLGAKGYHTSDMGEQSSVTQTVRVTKIK